MKKINVKGAVMKSAAVGGGAVAAAMLNKVPAIQKLTPLVRGAVKIAIGALVPSFLSKGKKGELMENVGAGMIAVGSLELANATAFKTSPVSVSGIMPTLGNAPVYYNNEPKASTLGCADSPEYSY